MDESVLSQHRRQLTALLNEIGGTQVRFPCMQDSFKTAVALSGAPDWNMTFQRCDRQHYILRGIVLEGDDTRRLA